MNILHIKSQQEIIKQLQISDHFDPKEEASKRIEFLKSRLRQTGKKSFILGISGGIDSTVAGRLAQLAVESLREEQYPAHFLAVRLPYNIQLDETDAQNALKFINPDQALTINIQSACDATIHSIVHSTYLFESEKQQDIILGNIKARQRMIVQYALANGQNGLVIGTDHAAEAVMGFFTKFGDGGCDLTPLTGLTKRRVKALGEYLGAPASLVHKKPTADLENLDPLRLDEEVHGITYDQIDDFLEGKTVDLETATIIIAAYECTEHKRQLPAAP